MNNSMLGMFDNIDGMMQALEQARERRLEIIDVYTPVPDHHVAELVSPKKSPVRYVSFSGGITGLVAGMALAIGTSLVWNLIVGGKPVTSIIPFLVIGFELTILFGALATLAALLLFGGMPYRKFPTAGYRPEFSDDRFGVWIGGAEQEARKLLEEAGAVEVQAVEGGAGP
jgi:molybdopterin-containing oxidoreductase family membrane subunit